jgi:hypothetical protein
VALRAEVVDLGRVNEPQRAIERRRVVQVSVVEEQAPVGDVRVLVEMIDAARVEGGRASDDAVDLVTLLEQELGQVGAVLPGDAGDQRTLHESPPFDGAEYSAGHPGGQFSGPNPGPSPGPAVAQARLGPAAQRPNPIDPASLSV